MLICNAAGGRRGRGRGDQGGGRGGGQPGDAATPGLGFVPRAVSVAQNQRQNVGQGSTAGSKPPGQSRGTPAKSNADFRSMLLKGSDG